MVMAMVTITGDIRFPNERPGKLLSLATLPMKQFQKFEKVKNGTPFKNIFFYIMLIYHLSNVLNGVLIPEFGVLTISYIWERKVSQE